MIIETFELKYQTTGGTDLIDITQDAAACLAESGLAQGLACLFTPGSTAALTTIEYESGALSDLTRAVETLAPREADYEHNRRWGDGNGYSHVRAALLGPSLSVPVSSGKMTLGTWQQIVLLDFDNRPRTRRVLVQVLGEGLI